MDRAERLSPKTPTREELRDEAKKELEKEKGNTERAAGSQERSSHAKVEHTSTGLMFEGKPVMKMPQMHPRNGR